MSTKYFRRCIGSMMFTPNLNPDIALGTNLVQPFCSINEDTGLALEFPRCAVECTTARLSDSAPKSKRT